LPVTVDGGALPFVVSIFDELVWFAKSPSANASVGFLLSRSPEQAGLGCKAFRKKIRPGAQWRCGDFFSKTSGTQCSRLAEKDGFQKFASPKSPWWDIQGLKSRL